MNIKEIKSKDNELIKKINGLKTKKFRERFSEFMAEGLISLNAGLCSDYELSTVFMSESFLKENAETLKNINEAYVLPDKLFEYISDAQTPQGIMGIFKIPTKNFSADKMKGCVLYCDNLRDPGNIGTIIRTADAFGIDSVLLSGGCGDVYMPKIVRSAMGSLFHTDVYQNISGEMLCDMKKDGFKIISSTLHTKSIPLYELDIPAKTVFVIGNEAHGVSDEILSISDEFIKIPMCGFAESLNAAVAAAIIMSEAARKRGYYAE